MERVRREIRLEADFGAEAFARAFATFRRTYNVSPLRAFCAPDVFARYCALFTQASDAHRHSTRLTFEGVALAVAILVPGTLVIEGEVDETQMGDW